MGKSGKWLESERETLRKKYPNKVILVCECKVVKTFDIGVKIHEILDAADNLCKGKDWSWEDLPAKECDMILFI